MTDRRVAFNQQINAITPSDSTDPYFLYVMVLLLKKVIQRASTNSMKGMINKSQFASIPSICPPHDLQATYGEFVKKQMGAATKLKLAHSESEALYQALAQHAFRGEL